MIGKEPSTLYCVKMPLLLKSIYTFKTALINIPPGLFREMIGLSLYLCERVKGLSQGGDGKGELTYSARYQGFCLWPYVFWGACFLFVLYASYRGC